MADQTARLASTHHDRTNVARRRRPPGSPKSARNTKHRRPPADSRSAAIGRRCTDDTGTGPGVAQRAQIRSQWASRVLAGSGAEARQFQEWTRSPRAATPGQMSYRGRRCDR